MRPTEKSFNQVKAIIGKLDRSIDELRARRTGDEPNEPAPAPAVAPKPAPGSRPSENSPPANRLSSPYGRATPLARGN